MLSILKNKHNALTLCLKHLNVYLNPDQLLKKKRLHKREQPKPIQSDSFNEWSGVWQEFYFLAGYVCSLYPNMKLNKTAERLLGKHSAYSLHSEKKKKKKRQKTVMLNAKNQKAWSNNYQQLQGSISNTSTPCSRMDGWLPAWLCIKTVFNWSREIHCEILIPCSPDHIVWMEDYTQSWSIPTWKCDIRKPKLG